jgi:hypothetical protein
MKLAKASAMLLVPLELLVLVVLAEAEVLAELVAVLEAKSLDALVDEAAVMDDDKACIMAWMN